MNLGLDPKPRKHQVNRRRRGKGNSELKDSKSPSADDVDSKRPPHRKSNKNQVKSRPAKKVTSNEKIADVRRKGTTFAKTSMSTELKDQVQQVEHLLGVDGFKVFKKGKNSTSYGLAAPGVLGSDTFIFVVTIPFSYPRQPSKLDPVNNLAEGKREIQVELGHIVNNFNSKAHEMTSAGQPLISQFNYLLTQWSKMTSPNYKQKERLNKEFLANI
ncbi:LADA_0A00320g1_1 [Lachancea dasiensis]|uniref:LADA_0A00320g1_1 n=1 Tax=Lachancea dasiensis TaxID=1072105 RepID=A0A1G4ILK2_9SACH|nr:LADA_0A00320g1_1 [Lachancea dasiensis]